MYQAEQVLLEFTSAIQPARRAWVQAAATVLSESGVSMSLGVAVILLYRAQDDAHQKSLSVQVGINPAAMVRVLDQGETAGLLVRREVPGNRRTKTVELLPQGKALAKRLEKALAALRADLLQDVSLSEIKIATKILRSFEARALAYATEKSEQ